MTSRVPPRDIPDKKFENILFDEKRHLFVGHGVSKTDVQTSYPVYRAPPPGKNKKETTTETINKR